MTPEDRAREALRRRLAIVAVAIDNGGFLHPGDAADAMLGVFLSTFEPHREELAAVLAAAGLHLVPEGHAVIGGRVVRLVDTGLSSAYQPDSIDGWSPAEQLELAEVLQPDEDTPDGSVRVPLFAPVAGGAPDTEGRHG